MPFRRAITNNMHLKFSALVVGIVLWMFAKGEQEGSLLISVPLVLRNMPDGLTTVRQIPRSVNVFFEGDNKELARLRLWGEPFVVIDMSEAQANRRFTVSMSPANVVVPQDVEVQVVEVRDPRNLNLDIDEIIDRRVRVKPVILGEPATGFFLFGRESTLPESVFVFGPEGVLSEIDTVRTAVLDIEGRRSRVDASRRIVFEGDWNLHAVPKEVRVLVDIEGTRVVTLSDVPTVFEHEPGFAEATVEPSTVDLTLSGPEHEAASLDSSDVTVLVNAMGLPRGTHELVPEVQAPDGIVVHGTTPPRVTVTLN